MAIQEILQSITDRMSAIATVNTVFGEPRVMHNRAIIPIAIVAGGFGAGGGEGKCGADQEGQQQEGNGGGGGGGFAVRPLAVLEVTDTGTHLIPIMDLTRITIAVLGLVGGAFWMMGKLKAKSNNHRHHRCR